MSSKWVEAESRVAEFRWLKGRMWTRDADAGWHSVACARVYNLNTEHAPLVEGAVQKRQSVTPCRIVLASWRLMQRLMTGSWAL